MITPGPATVFSTKSAAVSTPEPRNILFFWFCYSCLLQGPQQPFLLGLLQLFTPGPRNSLFYWVCYRCSLQGPQHPTLLGLLQLFTPGPATAFSTGLLQLFTPGPATAFLPWVCLLQGPAQPFRKESWNTPLLQGPLALVKEPPQPLPLGTPH